MAASMSNDRNIPIVGLLPRLQALDTTQVSDALDRLNISGVALGLRALSSGRRCVAGICRTVQVGVSDESRPSRHLASSTVEEAGSDDVVVISNSGRVDVSSWGGLLSLAASRKGIRGVVVDGACRDISESIELDFPVFARAVVPVSARRRLTELSQGLPVDIAGVSVAPGDVVIADSNGVVFIPVSVALDVVLIAEEIARIESQMMERLRNGASVVDVMHDRSFDSDEKG